MKHLSKAILSLMIFTGLFVGTAHALDGSRFGTLFGLRMLKSIIDANLAPEQQTDLANIVRTEREKIRPQVDAVIEAHRQLFTAINTDEFNERSVRDAAKSLAVAEEELAVSRAQLASKARALLTPEQKAKLESLRNEVSGRIDERIEEIRAGIDSWVESHAS